MNATINQPDAKLSGSPGVTRSRALSQSPEVEDALDKRQIAELSSMQITRMTRDELIRIVRTARMELLHRDIADHIELYDRATLERLVHLARRCCRNRGY
jgi:hypothetical protein